MPSKVYQVLPAKGLWTIKEVSARCASGRFDSKPDAVARAKELAAQALGDVIVLKADGSVEKEYPFKAPKVAAKAADTPPVKKRAPCCAKKK